MTVYYNGWTDEVTPKAIEQMMKEIGYDMTEEEVKAKEYVVNIFGHRSERTRNKDIINMISAFNAGYKTASESIEAARETDGKIKKWTYDDVATTDTLDAVLDDCIIPIEDQEDPDGHKAATARARTKEYCLNVLKYHSYKVRILSAIADSYYDGCYQALIDTK